MAKRGRPTIGDAKMTAKERKQRWDALMRNADGQVAGQPSRTPVVVYLSDYARGVLKRERALASEAELSSRTDSEVIEEALKLFEAGVVGPVTSGRQADLEDQISFLKSQVEHYVQMLQRPAPGFTQPSLHVRKRWYAEAVRALMAEAGKPEPKVAADLAQQGVRQVSGYFLEALAVDLDAVRRSGLAMEDREAQMATRLCAFLDLVLGVSR